MNTAFIILGNFGVGKSAVIKYPILETESIFLRIFDNTWVVGKTIHGADSLSKMTKQEVFKIIKQNPHKNLILAGVYYSSIIDVHRLKQTHNVTIIYLDTTYENNAKRIRQRGKSINVKTHITQTSTQISMMKQVKHLARIHIVDNNKTILEVKPLVRKIIQNETI